MSRDDFVKYEALGNDYLIIDPDRSGFVPSGPAVRAVCDRNRGMGADGVLFGPLPADDGPAHYRLQIFNADGSRCGLSGNGLRMFAHHLWDSGRAAGPELVLHTDAGATEVRIVDGERGIVDAELAPAVSLWEGPVTVDGETVEASLVDVGNPQCVLVLPAHRVSPEETSRLGPAVRDHPAWPERVNVTLAAIEDPHTVRIEIFERGAGYTLASGSSACAAVYALRQRGLVGDEVTVRMPGGEIEVRAGDAGRIILRGPCRPVFAGRWSAAFAGVLPEAG
jgi:diaminopimelate epimerase